jgi:hypothetical protein
MGEVSYRDNKGIRIAPLPNRVWPISRTLGFLWSCHVEICQVARFDTMSSKTNGNINRMGLGVWRVLERRPSVGSTSLSVSETLSYPAREFIVNSEGNRVSENEEGVSGLSSKTIDPVPCNV